MEQFPVRRIGDVTIERVSSKQEVSLSDTQQTSHKVQLSKSNLQLPNLPASIDVTIRSPNGLPPITQSEDYESSLSSETEEGEGEEEEDEEDRNYSEPYRDKYSEYPENSTCSEDSGAGSIPPDVEQKDYLNKVETSKLSNNCTENVVCSYKNSSNVRHSENLPNEPKYCWHSAKDGMEGGKCGSPPKEETLPDDYQDQQCEKGDDMLYKSEPMDVDSAFGSYPTEEESRESDTDYKMEASDIDVKQESIEEEEQESVENANKKKRKKKTDGEEDHNAEDDDEKGPADSADEKSKDSINEDEESSEKKKSKKSDETSSDADDASAAELKIGNMRRNIREVMDETKLEEATLAAQRQELERLRRVQEQQKLIRDTQRQIAMNRQNNKVQARVLSLLQGGSTSIVKKGSEPEPSAEDRKPNTVVVKLSSGSGPPQIVNKKMLDILKNQKNKVEDEDDDSSNDSSRLANLSKNLNKPQMVTASVSIAPVRLGQKKEDEETESSVSIKKSKSKDVVTITSSSSSEDDDCIVISEEEEMESETEEDPSNSGMHTNDLYNIPDEQGRVLINVGHPESEPDVYLSPQIARVIKPHQIGGVRFLFDNVVESIERYKTSEGFGCILAHSMGLGKTLQVISFCDVFLRYTEGKTVLCIMPINTLQNWVAEFNLWLPVNPDASPLKENGEVEPRQFPLFVLNDSQKTLMARAQVVQSWHKGGGVLLIGYELYRQLSLKKPPKRKGAKRKTEPEEDVDDDKKKTLVQEMYEALVKPGPDLVICDEGHRIKNSHASISQALKQIRSKRRIVLTGYPLQNNLLEYWCMVDFVRPNYLGTKTEFSNMFERPIQNGQCIDSTPQDIRLMRYRAHVLHSLLEGFVQRRSHAVLQQTLPRKYEFVLLLRFTPFQRKLYNTFMNEVVRTKAVPNPLKAFAVCCKIWNHPDILYNFLKKRAGDEEMDLDLDETTPTIGTPASTPATPATPSSSQPVKRRRRSFKGAQSKEAKTLRKNSKMGPEPTPLSVPVTSSSETPVIKSEPPQEQNYNPGPQHPSQFSMYQNQRFPSYNQNGPCNSYTNQYCYNDGQQSGMQPPFNSSYGNQQRSQGEQQYTDNYYAGYGQNCWQNQNASYFQSSANGFYQNQASQNTGNSSQYTQNYTNNRLYQQQQNAYNSGNYNFIQKTESGLKMPFSSSSSNNLDNFMPAYTSPVTSSSPLVGSGSGSGSSFYDNRSVHSGGSSSRGSAHQELLDLDSSLDNSTFGCGTPGSRTVNMGPPSGSYSNLALNNEPFLSPRDQRMNPVNFMSSESFQGVPNMYSQINNTQQSLSPGNYGALGNLGQIMNNSKFTSGLPGGAMKKEEKPKASKFTPGLLGGAQNYQANSGSNSAPDSSFIPAQNHAGVNAANHIPGNPYSHSADLAPQNPNAGLLNDGLWNQLPTNQDATNFYNSNYNIYMNQQDLLDSSNQQSFLNNFSSSSNLLTNSFSNSYSTNNSLFGLESFGQNYMGSSGLYDNQGLDNTTHNNFMGLLSGNESLSLENAVKREMNILQQDMFNANFSLPMDNTIPDYNNLGSVYTSLPDTVQYNNSLTQQLPNQSVLASGNRHLNNMSPGSGSQVLKQSSPNQVCSGQLKQQQEDIKAEPSQQQFDNESEKSSRNMNRLPSMDFFHSGQHFTQNSELCKSSYQWTGSDCYAPISYNKEHLGNESIKNPSFEKSLPIMSIQSMTDKITEVKTEISAKKFPTSHLLKEVSNDMRCDVPPYLNNAANSSSFDNIGFNRSQQNFGTQHSVHQNFEPTLTNPPRESPVGTAEMATNKRYTNQPNSSTSFMNKQLLTTSMSSTDVPASDKSFESAASKESMAIKQDTKNDVYKEGTKIQETQFDEKTVPFVKRESKSEDTAEASAKNDNTDSEAGSARTSDANIEAENEDGDDGKMMAPEPPPAQNKGKEDTGIPYDWATELFKDYEPGHLDESAKMLVFFCMLEEAVLLGDRLLLFSQSLFTLDLIEDFLHLHNIPNKREKWARNRNYFRLDGSTSALDREKLINEFNVNTNIHLFLVSTRAGSLGINLVGANRVIVFDASWNPCHDTQAVCRVYRYGQQKSCYVYRFVMDNCLEKKIYDRQINKQGMSDRVVDECNPDAHLTIKDVTNLCWDNDEEPEDRDVSQTKDKYADVVIQKVVEKFGKFLSKEPFQHESLLVDRKDKKLSQAEKRMAKRSYELEKQANARNTYTYYGPNSTHGLQIRTGKSFVGARPFQAENSVGNNGPRKWIPVDVWQKQGMNAQEMTLPLDVVIPTNTGDARSSIVLKAGQKVMVLKSPKGIYMQLENGKIIAIKTAVKTSTAGTRTLGSRSNVGTQNNTRFQRLTDKNLTNLGNRRDITLAPVRSRFSLKGNTSLSLGGVRPRLIGNPRLSQPVTRTPFSITRVGQPRMARAVSTSTQSSSAKVFGPNSPVTITLANKKKETLSKGTNAGSEKSDKSEDTNVSSSPSVSGTNKPEHANEKSENVDAKKGSVAEESAAVETITKTCAEKAPQNNSKGTNDVRSPSKLNQILPDSLKQAKDFKHTAEACASLSSDSRQVGETGKQLCNVPESLKSRRDINLIPVSSVPRSVQSHTFPSQQQQQRSVAAFSMSHNPTQPQKHGNIVSQQTRQISVEKLKSQGAQDSKNTLTPGPNVSDTRTNQEPVKLISESSKSQFGSKMDDIVKPPSKSVSIFPVTKPTSSSTNPPKSAQSSSSSSTKPLDPNFGTPYSQQPQNYYQNKPNVPYVAHYDLYKQGGPSTFPAPSAYSAFPSNQFHSNRGYSPSDAYRPSSEFSSYRTQLQHNQSSQGSSYSSYTPQFGSAYPRFSAPSSQNKVQSDGKSQSK